MPQLEAADLTGKVVTIFGLGDEKKCLNEFIYAIGLIHGVCATRGARLIGDWPTTSYEFDYSQAVDGDHLGLGLDQINQPVLTEGHLDCWLAQIRPNLLQ